MRLRIRISTLLAGVSLLFLSTPARAHHSLPTFYDVDKVIKVVGVVKSIRIMNPHSEFVFMVTEDGKEVEWVGVGGNSTQMTRVGWTNDTIKPGATVTFEGNPLRRVGGKGLLLKTFTLADGRKLVVGEVN